MKSSSPIDHSGSLPRKSIDSEAVAHFLWVFHGVHGVELLVKQMP